MATVKIKLRPSSVEGKAGVIFYQITHNRKTQHITTRLRVQPLIGMLIRKSWSRPHPIAQ